MTVQITQADIKRAAGLWRVSVPDKYVNLLDAQGVSDESNLEKYLKVGAVIYLLGRYFVPYTGSFIGFLAVREALDATLNMSAIGMNQFTKQVIAGDITIDEWKTKMLEQIMTAQIAAAVAARGGLVQMTDTDWQTLQARINTQYDYLDKFAKELEQRKQDETLAALALVLLVRSELYADAGMPTYEAFRTLSNIEQGMREERYVLDPDAMHCEGCIERAGKQWQPINSLPPLGAEECGVRDRCTKQYRDANGVVSEAE